MQDGRASLLPPRAPWGLPAPTRMPQRSRGSLDECGGLRLGVTSHRMSQGQVALVLSMIL